MLRPDEMADFLVSPYPAEAVRAYAAETSTVFLEGGFTPGEIAEASARGIAKLFPAHVGGPAYLRSVLAVLPGDSVAVIANRSPDRLAVRYTLTMV